ncbi:mediator of RNA polymerase II transcription subunit 15-like isoform X1 [Lytechinus variegatus]|uniref:mediator of RNA polymerase II transcription subunit 15-like isoform X1 n=1 Tax=Lytechinus variegatus TaxID=7654 RepID=UPI001BB246EC|nr:mediator of RNA polymerase II transcription subunit 15-like isoform X1 [Lytechinus variegatus]XP_041480751.1 mediator of RNA polymerase II transcription subunit 15-like isoform X1 [Lytechinus variegatus]
MVNSRSSNSTSLDESPDEGSSAYRGCISKSINVTGVLHIVAGALCIVFGISAIILKAFVSYLGIPIWVGLLIFIVTGSFGVANYYKPASKKIMKYYMVMSTVSSVFSFSFLIAFSIFLHNEGGYWESFVCHPLARSICNSPEWTRYVIDAVLILIFVLEAVCSMTSACLSCYKNCDCYRHGLEMCKTCKMCNLAQLCRKCQEDPGNSNIMYYAVNMGDMPMMTLPNDNQSSGPIYIAGESPESSGQPGQFMYLSPSPQHQNFMALPAVSPQNQHIPKLPPPPQQQEQSQQQPQPSKQQPQPLEHHQVQQLPEQPQAQQLPQQHQVQQPPQQHQQQVLLIPQTSGVNLQQSGAPSGQAGFVQFQAPRQMQPLAFAPTQQLPQLQPAGMAPQVSGSPQVGFFQVRGPGGQVQMVPAPFMYPQVMMAPATQQPTTGAEQVRQELDQQEPIQQELVQQPIAPSNSAEANVEE